MPKIEWKNEKCRTCDYYARLSGDAGQCQERKVIAPAISKISLQWGRVLEYEDACGRWKPQQ